MNLITTHSEEVIEKELKRYLKMILCYQTLSKASLRNTKDCAFPKT
jgi:hypothetical protein